MSLDLYEREAKELVERSEPVTQAEPALFEGFARGVGTGIVRNIAVPAAKTTALIGSLGAMAYDNNTGGRGQIADGTSAVDRHFQAWDEIVQSATDYWTPKPADVGEAGRVTGDLLGQLGAILSAPMAAPVTTFASGSMDLTNKGVGDNRAQKASAIQAAGLTAGLWMPILGQNLWQRVLVGGTGFNMAQGIVTRGAVGDVLQGLPVADEYKSLDLLSLTLDGVLGAAFGAGIHYIPAMKGARDQGREAWNKIEAWAKNMTPEELAAVSLLREAQHLNVDSTPGRPATPADLDAHVERVRAVLGKMMRDEPAGSSDSAPARFEPDPERLRDMYVRSQELMGEAAAVAKEERLLPPAAEPGAAQARRALVPEDIAALPHPAQAEAIGGAVAGRLREIGMPEDEAAANGAIWRAFFGAAAKRYGLAPAELMRRYGLEINRFEGPREGALQQTQHLRLRDAFAQSEELFRYPRVASKDLKEIVQAIDPDLGLAVRPMPEHNAVEQYGPGVRVREIRDSSGREAHLVENDKGQVWVNLAGWGQGGGGNAIYAIAGNYAHQNGLKFIGDPAGVSTSAMYRRAEAMLSSALKYGTTRHLEPHPDQLTGNPDKGIEALVWREGDDHGNVRSLLQATYGNVRAQVPDIEHISYDPGRREFVDTRSGSAVSEADFRALANTAGARAARAGRATLKRAALAGTLLRAAGDERSGLLAEVLRQSRQDLDSPLSGLYYQGTKQTESPAFKRFFSGSKVVDDGGAPLIVYHAGSFNAAEDGVPAVGKDGFHFGTKNAAQQRIHGKIADDFIRELELDQDEHGKWHWQSNGIESFDTNPEGFKSEQSAFNDAARAASEYADNTIEGHEATVTAAYLSIKNPKMVPDQKESWAAAIAKAKREGYDGLVYKNQYEDKGSMSYIAFRPEQIKSATDNRGAFDPRNPNILYQDAAPRPAFFSALERAIEGNPTKAQTARGWLDWLKNLPQKGVKAEEIRWSGIAEWLEMQHEAGDTKVSKDAVQAFLKQNGVKVTETELGRPGEDFPSFESLPQEVQEIVHRYDTENLAPDQFQRELQALGYEAHMEYGELDGITVRGGAPTQFGQYTLPGAKEGSYRELLLTLPVGKPQQTDKIGLAEVNAFKAKMREKYGDQWLHKANAEELRENERLSHAMATNYVAGRTNEQQVFTSSHFDEHNILAHVRFNERTDADGKRVLFIEEIQSDWAQQGKRRGFSTRSQEEINADVNKVMAELNERERSAGRELTSESYARHPDLDQRRTELIEELAAAGKGGGVPAAPFVGKTDAWVGLTMKRMIRYAAEHGFDRVAWTTGEQQVTRYTHALRKAVDSIEWKKTDEGVQLVGYKGGKVKAASDESINQRQGDLDVARALRGEVVQQILDANGGTYRALLGGEPHIATTNDDAQVGQFGIEFEPGQQALFYPNGGMILRMADGSYDVAITQDERSFGPHELAAAEKYLWEDYVGSETPESVPQQNLRERLQEANLAIHEAERNLTSVNRSAGPRRKVVDTVEKEDALSDAIGKAMADRIRNDPAQEGTIEGANIKIDDTGMASFYDRIVPNVAKDVLKKLGGGKITETELPIRDESARPQYRNARATPDFDAIQEGDSLAGVEAFADGEPPLQAETRIFINSQGVDVLAVIDKNGLYFINENFELGLPWDQMGGKAPKTQDDALNKVMDKWDSADIWENLDILHGDVGKVETSKQMSFEITPAMRDKAMAGQPLFQPAKGQIQFAGGRTMIDLFQAADRSTFGHESGHLFLEITKDLAMRPDAPEGAVQDWATLAQWLKIEGGQIPREAHEQFARGFEAYLREGNAPSEELRGAFQRFRDWLLEIYHSIAALRVELNDDVRGVIDRMLASQAEDPAPKTEGPSAQRSASSEPPPPPGEGGAAAEPARPEATGPRERTMTMRSLQAATKPGPLNLRRREAREEIARRQEAGEGAFGRDIPDMTDKQLATVVADDVKYVPQLRAEAMLETTRRAERNAHMQELLQDPEVRTALEVLAGDAGWAQIGGKYDHARAAAAQQAGETGVVAFTEWVPKAEWWLNRPEGATEAQAKSAVQKALAGESLNAAERRMLGFLVDVAHDQLELYKAIPEPEVRAIEEDWALTHEGTTPTQRDVVDVDLVARAAEIDEGAVERAAQAYGNDDAGFLAAIRSIIDANEHEQAQGAPGDRQANQPAASPGPATEPAAGAATPEPAEAGRPGEPAGAGKQSDPVKLQAERFIEDHPDQLLRVGTNPDGTPIAMTAKEYLEGARESAKDARKDIGLLEIAAACMLGGR